MRKHFLGCVAPWLLLASAQAESVKASPKIEAEQKFAVGLSSNDANQALLVLKPSLDAKYRKRWSASLAVRFEAAGLETGLGTTKTFSGASSPLEFGSDARVEIDEAVLQWRKRSTRLRIGKQTVAWGVLDGIQITDRFDAARRREAIFIDQRPDRISRWGARAQFSTIGLKWDVATFFDGTADQLAEPGSTFDVVAPRFRAGFPIGAPLPDVGVRLSQAATYGARMSKSFGNQDISVLAFRGPDTEPAIEVSNTGVDLVYRKRTLLGATWQRSAGSRVLRAEVAYIPDQSVNILNPIPEIRRRRRVLAGVGLDWSLSGGVFLNAQLGADWVEGDDLVRPSTDVVATIKLRKSWANNTYRSGAELIATTKGDGVFRPSLSWQVNDMFQFNGGLDLIWGDRSDSIGQFNNRDRFWLSGRWSF